MRILFLTNFYLTHGAGGEEQSCQQVVEGLKQRGHTTLVLTSMHDSDNLPAEVEGIDRSLYLEMDLVPLRHSINFFTRRKVRERHNLQVFARAIQQFDPDIIFIWGMWNLPRSLPAYAEAKYPQKVVYRFASYWPTLPSQHVLYWRAPGRSWYSRLLKKLVGYLALSMLANEAQEPPLVFRHAICVSAATRDVLVEAGMPVSGARIIYTGLDTQKYLPVERNQRGHDERNFKMLYAGRLVSEKGIDTAIKAMTHLVFDNGLRDIRLTLAGSGSTDYENYLRSQVSQAGLTDHVSFLGWVPPEDMPGLLRSIDVLLVPSVWPEPLARVVLEGMISGLVIVATPTGGTRELIADGKNGLLFTPSDAEDLAQRITCLVNDPDLRLKLSVAAQQTVVERFTVTKMLDEIESYFQEIVLESAQQEVSV